MRAPGFPQGSYALESALDELALELKMDPLELRRKNFVEQPLLALDKIYALGAQRIGWSRRSELGPRASSPVKRGIGMGTAVWPNYSGPPARCRVTINSDGSVEAAIAVQDIGTGTRTVVAMVAAEELGVPVEAVKVTIGDTSLELIAPDSGGSVTALSISPAVRAAAADAKAQLFKRVAPALNAMPEDLVMEEGKIFSRAQPKSFLTWKQAAARLGAAPVAGLGERLPNVEPYARVPLWGAQFAEVEVDVETGKVELVHVVTATDIVQIIDPLSLENQLHGSLGSAGLDSALFEESILDKKSGRFLNINLVDYKWRTFLELPAFQTVTLETPFPTHRFKAIGVGEISTAPGPSAILMAVSNAIGKRMHDYPLTPDKILEVLGKTKIGKPKRGLA
jgi:CO/xanthine dehydrogenase Mo-binding subunit